MNKRFILCFITWFAAALADTLRLPDEFNVVERFLSYSSTFDVGTETEPFAIARKRFFSLTTTFDLEDRNQQPLASASARFFSWGTTADVTDPAGNYIGRIEEDIFRIFPWAEYRVFNSENRIVAIAKMNVWGTHFEVYHPDNAAESYATIHRPFFRFYRDYWTVRIQNDSVFEKEIDPRLLIILAVYQTDKDARDTYRSLIINQLVQEQDFYGGNRFN